MPLTHFHNEHHRFFCRQFLCENASSSAFLVDKSVLHVGCNGRHGQHVDYNLTKNFQGYDQHPGIYHSAVNSKAHLSNLLLTMAQKMDVPTEKFADSNDTASEVL